MKIKNYKSSNTIQHFQGHLVKAASPIAISNRCKHSMHEHKQTQGFKVLLEVEVQKFILTLDKIAARWTFNKSATRWTLDMYLKI